MEMTNPRLAALEATFADCPEHELCMMHEAICMELARRELLGFKLLSDDEQRQLLDEGGIRVQPPLE
jgi:hypothetical protein